MIDISKYTRIDELVDLVLLIFCARQSLMNVNDFAVSIPKCLQRYIREICFCYKTSFSPASFHFSLDRIVDGCCWGILMKMFGMIMTFMITKRAVLLVGSSAYYVKYRDREVNVEAANLANPCSWLKNHWGMKKLITKLCGNIRTSRYQQMYKNLSIGQKMTEVSILFSFFDEIDF